MSQAAAVDPGPVDGEEESTDRPATTRYSQGSSPPSSSPVRRGFDGSGSRDGSREAGEEAGGESDSSGLPAEDASALTNGVLSEEEEAGLSGNESLLPVSVLDRAGAIAEGFVSSLSRRGSLVSEELAFSSPLAQTDAFESPSARGEAETGTSAGFTPEPRPTSVEPPPARGPEETSFSEGGRRSTLSKQDRLLIHKIRRYYEHAEHQDASFSIKRRESLSYIPAGLVRNLSRQLNFGPQDKAVPAYRRGLSRNRPTSWSVFDLPGLGQSQSTPTHPTHPTHPIPELKSSPVEAEAPPRSAADTTEEEFRPSADMLKVWNDMEMENQEVQQIPEETCDDLGRTELDTDSDVLENGASEEPPRVLEEPENWPSSKESSLPSQLTSFPAALEESPQESRTQEKNQFSAAHLPKIVTFQKCTEEDQILEDMGRVKSKVFQLARQYSQRIKNNRPLVWQRNRGTGNQQGFRNVPAVQEKTGKRLSGETASSEFQTARREGGF